MKICNCSLAGTDACKTCSSYPHSYHIVNDLIDQLASAKPERKKGTWFLTDTMYACNQCHSVFYETSPFCPICGADMRGEQV